MTTRLPQILYLPMTNWDRVSSHVQTHVINLAHSLTGSGRPIQVRMDVPPELAEAPRAEYVALLDWLEDQHLNALILGSHRKDIRVEIR